MCRNNELIHSKRHLILHGVCTIPLLLGACSLCLGIWLCVAVLHNSGLPLDEQIKFEKVVSWKVGRVGDEHGQEPVIHNEPSFSYTPLDNLSFFLMILSLLTIVGGGGRVLGTILFCFHLHRSRLTNHLFWSWFLLSAFAVMTEVFVTWDLMCTLSHIDVAPPYQREFFFVNDSFGFYWLCHGLRHFIFADLVLSAIAQIAACLVYVTQFREDQF